MVKRILDNVPVMTIYFLLHKYRLNHRLIYFLSNRLDWVDSSQWYLDKRESSRNIFDSNLESSWCDSNLKNFRAQFFHLHNYFLRSAFLKCCCLYGFILGLTLTYHCTLPRQTPSDQVEDVAVVKPGPVNLWAWDSDGFWWVHSCLCHSCSDWNQHSFCYHFSDSWRRIPNHRVPIYQWNLSLGQIPLRACCPTVQYLSRYPTNL